MSPGSIAAAGKASLGTEARFTRIHDPLPLRQVIPRLARKIWPAKTAAELASRAGISDRACRSILAERASLSGETLAALLRSDGGLDVLAAIMGDAKPAWWAKFRRSVELGKLRRDIDLQRRRIEETSEAIAELERSAS